MAQAIAETLFDIFYLGFDIIIGAILIKKSDKLLTKMFGYMTILLGAGDAFHLVPRAYSLWTTGLEANAKALGFGKFVTSITMTIFYLILFYIWMERYNKKDNKKLIYTMWGLSTARIALCFLPGNDWLSYIQPVSYGILRNIPFAIMGIIVIVIFYQQAKLNNDRYFKNIPMAVFLSFAFYIPVVLFADAFPLVGMLMIPKTIAYMWIVYMGYNLFNSERTK